MMQPGPPWPREGSAVPGRRAGERTTKRAQLSRGVGGPWEAGPPHLCSGLVTPAGTGSGPAPCFESLLRPPALCLGPKLALSAAPERERAGCASQVRAAASALRPCQRPAGRAGSNWLGKGEGRGPCESPRGGRRCIHSVSSQKVSKPEPAGDLMARGSQVLRPEVYGKGSERPRGAPLPTLAMGGHGRL